MKQARLLLVGMLMVLLRADRPAAVVAFLGPAEVSLRILTSAPGGFSEPKCSKSVKIARADRFEWRIAIDEATPAGNREKTVLSVRCGTEPGSSNGSPSDRASIPTLSASISTLALLENQAEDEKVLRVEVKINSQELTGFEDGGKPSHHSVNSRRELFFAGSGVAYLPLWLPDERIREPLGLNEVLLEISAKMPAQAAPPGYGTLRLLSVPGSSAVLLDGGAVKLLPGKEPKIENVRPGLRLVSVRDASGRDVRRIVRVEADRTSLVDFGPAAGGPGRLGPIGRNPQGFVEFRREIDGAVVVQVPAGEFPMGHKDTERTPLEHRVYVSEFLLDKLAVTWSRYRRFAAAAGIPLPPHDPYWGMHDDHPAVYVTWEEAQAYCEWAGGRLPTEAEREKAARGTDGRKYPWGDEEPDGERGVFRHAWGYAATEEVGTHPKGVSPYGLEDMGGNVWEWCSDWYDDNYYQVSPKRDPKGPPNGTGHVVRGGSWDSRPAVLAGACRNWGQRGYREGDFGFRCAMDSTK